MSSELHWGERGGVGLKSWDVSFRGFRVDFYLFQIVLPIGGNSRWWRERSGDGALCSYFWSYFGYLCHAPYLLRCSYFSSYFCYTAPSKLSRLLINWVLLLVLRCHFYYVSTCATLIPPNCPIGSTASDHFGKLIDVNCNSSKEQWPEIKREKQRTNPSLPERFRCET